VILCVPVANFDFSVNVEVLEIKELAVPFIDSNFVFGILDGRAPSGYAA
jgi:hypothetical protein